MHMDEIDI